MVLSLPIFVTTDVKDVDAIFQDALDRKSCQRRPKDQENIEE